MGNTEIIIIDGKKYKVDSSGARPGKFIDGICWILNGKFHRVDGPATIYNIGIKIWYQNGQRHNLKGPAVIYPNGAQYWWIKDKLIGLSTEGFTQEKFEEYLNGDFEKLLELIV